MVMPMEEDGVEDGEDEYYDDDDEHECSTHNHTYYNQYEYYEGRDENGNDESFMGEAGSVSVIILTETINFILMDIVHVFMIGCLKMLVDFVVKPVMSVYQKGIVTPVTLVGEGLSSIRQRLTTWAKAGVMRVVRRKASPYRKNKLCEV